MENIRNLKGQFKNGNIGFWHGKHRSKKTKKKISKANTGKHPTKKTLKKMSKASTGRHHSKNVRKRMSEAKKGKNNSMFGRRGELHPLWRGGISFEPYGLEFNENLKEVIRNRDKRKCWICEKTELENCKKLDVHHIDYNKQNNNPENLILLCHSCHTKTNHYRKKWINFFTKKK